jgi:hypothetical protein
MYVRLLMGKFILYVPCYALRADGLKPWNELESGIDYALEIVRHTEKVVVPIAWALFMGKSAWDEWLFAEIDEGIVLDKGRELMKLARQGRCVLTGRKTRNQS